MLWSHYVLGVSVLYSPHCVVPALRILLLGLIQGGGLLGRRPEELLVRLRLIGLSLRCRGIERRWSNAVVIVVLAAQIRDPLARHCRAHRSG
jgi:hypothetical protein